MIVSRRRAWRSSMVEAYVGNFAPPASAYCREVVRAASPSAPVPCRARPSCRRGRSSGRCRARCSRCRPRSARAARSAPKQCAVTLAPCSWATRIASSNVSCGNDGARSPSSREIQSPTSFTQPSPRWASSATVGRPGRRARPRGVVADVPLGPGDVPPGAHQPRQVLAVVDPGGVRPASRSRGAAARRRRGRRPPVPRRSPRRRRRSSSRPTWQCASTRPGTIQPSPPVSAPACVRR